MYFNSLSESKMTEFMNHCFVFNTLDIRNSRASNVQKLLVILSHSYGNHDVISPPCQDIE